MRSRHRPVAVTLLALITCSCASGDASARSLPGFAGQGCARVRERPAGTSQLHPNEPPGLRVVADRSFSASPEMPWVDYAPEHFSIVHDPTAPQSPPLVGQATYPAGFSGGSEPINLYVTIPDTKALYVSWWMKLSPGFEGHPRSGVNKIFHIWIGGANRVTLSAQGSGTSTLQPQVRLQRVAVPGGAVNLLPNVVPGATVVRGRWQHWELALAANGDANADGSVELWLDGVKVSDYCDQRFVAGSRGARWQSLNWAPTWGGTGASVRHPMYMWIDHIYISGL